MTRSYPLRPAAILCAALTLAVLPLNADPIRVTQPQGSMHGFLEMHSPSGELIGHGDLLQSVQGDRITIDRILHFKDGSLDDDTAVFTQNRTFRLISDHHIQKGPFFPQPSDLLVESNGQVTSRTVGSDGKEKIETQHIDLPPDIANGIVGPMLMNVPPNTPQFHISLVVPVGKGRLVKLATAPEGERTFMGAGVQRKATVFDLKFELGGMIGMLAPMVGKQPEDAHIWVVEGSAPEIVRVQQQLYQGGPVVSIEAGGCTFPKG